MTTKLILPNPLGYKDQTARYRSIHSFEYRAVAQTLLFDSWSNKIVTFEALTRFTPHFGLDDSFSFTPSEIIKNPEDRSSIVILDCMIPKNPLTQYSQVLQEQEKYFSFPNAKILQHSGRVMHTDSGKTAYHQNLLVLNRLVLLVPLNFRGVFIYSSIPNLEPKFRIIRVGSWYREKAKHPEVLSPIIQINSI